MLVGMAGCEKEKQPAPEDWIDVDLPALNGEPVPAKEAIRIGLTGKGRMVAALPGTQAESRATTLAELQPLMLVARFHMERHDRQWNVQLWLDESALWSQVQLIIGGITGQGWGTVQVIGRSGGNPTRLELHLPTASGETGITLATDEATIRLGVDTSGAVSYRFKDAEYPNAEALVRAVRATPILQSYHFYLEAEPRVRWGDALDVLERLLAKGVTRVTWLERRGYPRDSRLMHAEYLPPLDEE